MTNAWTGGSQSFDVTTFDAMNRRKQERDGQRAGLHLHAHQLNTYSQCTVPGAIDVLGTASTSAAVTVNGSAIQRQGSYFYQALTGSNGAAPVLLTGTIAAGMASGTSTRSVSSIIPKTLEVLSYDVDGNLTADGLWTYTWDGENRLIGMEVCGCPGERESRRALRRDHGGSRRLETGRRPFCEAGRIRKALRHYRHRQCRARAEPDGNLRENGSAAQRTARRLSRDLSAFGSY